MKRPFDESIGYRSLALLLCFLLSPLHDFAQSKPAGNVSALRTSATRNSTTVKVKDVVNWNDLLQTDTTGRMRIALDDGSILSMGSNSELRVLQHNAAAQQSQLELNFGRLRSQVVKHTRSGSSFEVRTPVAVAGVIGTDFFLDATPTHTHLVVYEGVVRFTPIIGGVLAPEKSVEVRGGQSADVDRNANVVVGPIPTPPGEQDQTIALTTIETLSKTKVAGVTGSHALRNTLIVLGVVGAAVGIGVGVSQGGGSNSSHQQIPPQ